MTSPVSSPASSALALDAIVDSTCERLHGDPALVRELGRRLIERAAAPGREAAAPPTRLRQHPFLAHVSHEMRAPLNGMIGMTSLLLRSGLDDRQRRFATLARSSAEVLLRLVNDILDLAYMESGHFRLDPRPFAFASLVTEAVETLRPEADRKGVGLALHLAAGLPRIALGDGQRVRQVLTNLVGNAVKFTAHGRVAVEVVPGAADRVRFEVRDTGPGLSEAAQARLFNEFVQEDTRAARTSGGTGLGLAVSRQLAWLMQGEIGVRSAPGQGSTFWFELPLPQTRATDAA